MAMILASKSPRRQDLLRQMGLTDFKVIPAEVEETVDPALAPPALAEALALQKARAVAQQYAAPGDLIIGADTIVVLDHQVLGKPRNAAHALQMLTALSGRNHLVYTGIAVLQDDVETVAHEVTEVHFCPLTDEEMLRYIKTGEPMDKAGAYGIQGRGALLINWIRGDYCNVVGLPLCRLGKMLARFGVHTI